MDRRSWVRAYRGFFPLLAFVAMGYQLYHLHDTRSNYRDLDFFSFFTIESNIFASLVLLYAAWKGADQTETHRFAMVRGAAVLYMATTGVVYGCCFRATRKNCRRPFPGWTRSFTGSCHSCSSPIG
jgi:hypothetical protein